MTQRITDKITKYNKDYNIIRLIFIDDNSDKKINFIKNIDIFTNLSEIQDKIKLYLTSKSINYKYITKKIIRDYYYSQIRDTENNNYNIYTEELMFIDKLPTKINNIDIILFSPEKIIQDKFSFPNISQYHFSFEINSINIIIDKIQIIFENNNIFIDLEKKFNETILNNIFDILFN